MSKEIEELGELLQKFYGQKLDILQYESSFSISMFRFDLVKSHQYTREVIASFYASGLENLLNHFKKLDQIVNNQDLKHE